MSHLYLIALSARSDNSMMTNKRDQKLSTLSTKRVLPKIQHKKAAVTPRVLLADTKGPCDIANDKVSSRVVTSQSSSVVNYSPSAYADDMDHMTSLDNDNSVDGDTQLAIDVLRSQSDTSILYHYSSHPHSAQRKSPNAKYSTCTTHITIETLISLVIVYPVTEVPVWMMIFIHLAVAVVSVMSLLSAHPMCSGSNSSQYFQTNQTPSPVQPIVAPCLY